MPQRGIDVMSKAMWKAQNAARAEDALALYVMELEFAERREDASAVIEALGKEGYAVVPLTLEDQTVDALLMQFSSMRADDEQVVMLRQRMTDFYDGSVRLSERPLTNPMIRSLITSAVTKRAETQRDAGERPFIMPYDRVGIERMSGLICEDLIKEKHTVIACEPPHDLVEKVILKAGQKGTGIALVFGSDTDHINEIYRTVVENQRLH
jgi:hypothetical protein